MKKKQYISKIVMKWLLVCVLAAFACASAISYISNTHLAKQSTEHLLTNSIEDALDELQEKDEKSVKVTLDNLCTIVEGKEFWNNISPDRLNELCGLRNIQEIHVIDSTGIIIYSSVQNILGYDMDSSDQSRDFMTLLEDDGPQYYYQEVRSRGIDNVKFRYVGRKLAAHKGFLQIGFEEDYYYSKVVNGLLEGSTHHRRIGDSGSIYIFDMQGNIISSPISFMGETIEQTGLRLSDIYAQKSFEIFTADIKNEPSYCMYVCYNERYNIIAIQPISEATLTRDTAFGISSIIVFTIFLLLFCLIYWLMRKLVVNNIERVNKSLSIISEGQLEEIIDVRDSVEFDELSTDINMTVDRLKEFIHQAETRLDADLALAKAIQMAALPNVFPAFPDRSELDLFACTEPAKEVGGDFYDFYFVGEDKVAICIADVSGKGIPAAMFMMRSKSMLKNSASTGLGIADVFNKVNSRLASNNETNTFITCWMAVINIRTGEMQYVNGGHNAPLLRHSDGLYEYIEDPMPGLPLAVLEDFPYQIHTTTLLPGDELFLYTDGVTEAENIDKDQLGEELLRNTLNQLPTSEIIDPTRTCKAILKSVHAFANGAEQSDDITMLAFKYISNL